MGSESAPKTRLLETASRLFYEQGYHQTGINQILEESGVAKASLYTHYGSKDHLGLAYLKTASDAWLADLKAFALLQQGSLLRVSACFDFLETSMRLRNFRGCPFINMMAEISGNNKELETQVLQHKQQLRKLLRSFAAPVNGNEALADATYLLFEGAMVESKIFKQVWPIRSAKKSAQLLFDKQ